MQCIAGQNGGGFIESDVHGWFAAAQGIIVKDGPYGTAIQNLGLTAADYAGHIASNHDQKGNNDILNLTRPDAIAGICNRYIAAGARLLATNTFNANRISQADYGMEDRVREINLAAARIMREYARNQGPRQRVAPDFLIGAHASQQADALLTTDAGFFREYFKDLTVLTPQSS